MAWACNAQSHPVPDVRQPPPDMGLAQQGQAGRWWLCYPIRDQDPTKTALSTGLLWQEYIDSIDEWERVEWLTEFNPSIVKGQTLIIPNSLTPILHIYQLTWHLTRESPTKYLGFTIHADVKWNQHTHEITLKASCALYAPWARSYESMTQFPMSLPTTLVLPQVDFVSTVWDPLATPTLGAPEKQGLHTKL